jgi:hypothetical protein
LTKNRLTIARVMCLISVGGGISSLFVNPDDRGIVAVLLIASLVVVLSVHFAIEGNRRDDFQAEHCREHARDEKGSPGPV